MTDFTIRALGLLSIMFYCSCLNGQEELDQNTTTQKQSRQTLGLVLAGGGARGIAHAGVIQALEEMHIPIDAIAGTSMGALVGGLYASGMNANELQEVIFHMDWEKAFDDKGGRTDYPVRRKSDDYDYPTSITLSFKDGSVAFPMGLVQGQQVRLIIKELMRPVSHIKDFDKLPTPYRAVATDAETGKAYVFSKGDIVTAMRASMSLPGLLAPVEHDGKLLMDGGMANNIPVDVARNMGVDRLIVIDIGTPLKDRNELTSVLSIADQLVGFLTRKNSIDQLESLGKNDILVRPDIGSVSMMSFDQQELIYQKGYEAGMALADALQPLHLSKQSWLSYTKSKRPPHLSNPPIDYISIDNNSSVSDELIKVHISQPLEQPLNREQLIKDIAVIYALDYWEIVDYSVINENDSSGLLIHAKAKGWGGHELKVGANIVVDLDGRSELNLGSSYLLKGVNRLGGEVYFRAQIGSKSLLSAEFYQPLDLKSRFFLSPQLFYKSEEVLGFGPEHDLSEGIAGWQVREGQVNLAAGVNVFSSSQFRGGVFRNSGRYQSTTSSEKNANKEDFDEGGFFAYYRYDALDSAFFPKRGAFFYVNYEKNNTDYGSNNDFERMQLYGQAAFTFGNDDANTVIFTARTGQSNNASNEPQNYYQLGGLFNLSGAGQNFYSGRQMAFSMAQYQRKLSKNSVIPFDFPVYAGFSVEGGQLWSEREDIDISDFTLSSSIYLAVDTPVGPLYLAYGHTNESLNAVYFSLGWPFLSNAAGFGR